MTYQSNLYINGEYTKSSSGEYFEVINPADLSLVGEASKGNRKDCKAALKAADEAGAEWSSYSNTDRGNILEECVAKMGSAAEEIGKLLNGILLIHTKHSSTQIPTLEWQIVLENL